MTRALIHAGVGGFWTLLMAFTAGLVLTLLSGQGYRPAYLLWFLSGVLSALAMAYVPTGRGWPLFSSLVVLLICVLSLLAPFGQPMAATPLWTLLGVGAASIFAGVFGAQILKPVAAPSINRFRIEETLTQLLRGMGLLFFALIVIVPLYLMFAGSLYTTPSGDSHDFAELGGAKALFDPFRAYYNLFTADAGAIASNFFGRYFLNSVWVSIATVILTLALAVPGAYAISRLSFPGQRVLSRSVLLIYLVPVIVLVIPLFVMLTRLGLTNPWGLLLVYPATTLPVALYMLQGYFRGLPAELEEAGLMDGCSRLRVIWSITIPLALPAIASVALYVFMIAWNEFLIAFMLLSDQSSFTLPIGINSMNSSEVAEQDLMAAAVVATVPIVVLFLWAERFMVQGLTSGGVKG